MISALNSFREGEKEQFCHLLDQFHILKTVQKQVTKKATDSNAIGLLRTMMYTKSSKEYFEASNKLTKIEDPSFQAYMEKFMYKNLDRFCETQTPPLFHGLSITTSPLEKINDLIKTEIPYSAKPNFISKVEALTQRMTKYNVKVETTKLTRVHKDIYLQEVQRKVSSRVFEAFYSNYVEAG